MQNSAEIVGGFVNLDGAYEIENPDFRYTRFFEVNDPAIDAERAVALHIAPDSYTRVWQLQEPGYSEKFKLLRGSAYLAVRKSDEFVAVEGKMVRREKEWNIFLLDENNPEPMLDGEEIKIEEGDRYCLLTYDDEAVVLCRPTMPPIDEDAAGLQKPPRRSMMEYSKVIARSKWHEFYRRLFIYIDAVKRGEGDKQTLADDQEYMMKHTVDWVEVDQDEQEFKEEQTTDLLEVDH